MPIYFRADKDTTLPVRSGGSTTASRRRQSQRRTSAVVAATFLKPTGKMNMGFHRRQPASRDHGAPMAIVGRSVADEVAFATRTADPFLIDHSCINPSGHAFTGSCGDVVCVHCDRIVWS